MRGRTPSQVLDNHKKNKAAWPSTRESICHLDPRSGRPSPLHRSETGHTGEGGSGRGL